LNGAKDSDSDHDHPVSQAAPSRQAAAMGSVGAHAARRGASDSPLSCPGERIQSLRLPRLRLSQPLTAAARAGRPAWKAVHSGGTGGQLLSDSEFESMNLGRLSGDRPHMRKSRLRVQPGRRKASGSDAAAAASVALGQA
jgi:hypothetical protein